MSRIGKLYLTKIGIFMYPHEECDILGTFLDVDSLVLYLASGMWKARDDKMYPQHLFLVVKTQEKGWFTDTTLSFDNILKEIELIH